MSEAEKLAAEIWQLEEQMVPAIETILKNFERIQQIQREELPRLARSRFQPYEGNPYNRLGTALEQLKAHHRRYEKTKALS